MKYPLDTPTYIEKLSEVLEHEKSQQFLIAKMASILHDAVHCTSEDDAQQPWYAEADKLLEDLKYLKNYHESRRFNEANHKAQQPKEQDGPIVSASPAIEDADFDLAQSEMSEDDLARHFKEKKNRKQVEKPKPLEKMSLDEIESWEKQQDNSNDIYKIKARVANLARGPGVSLTPQGEMLCNTYVHVLKALYDFAETIEDKTIKIALTKAIRDQEGMPGTLISAAGAGVKMKKDEDKPV